MSYGTPDYFRPNAEQGPLFAGFASEAAALAYRQGAGGWIFVPDDGAGAVWFAFGFTASAVMLHPAAKGSGRLI